MMFGLLDSRRALTLAFGMRLLWLAIFLAWSPWARVSDVGFYQHLVQQSDAGHYPFLDFWLEYPPVFPWLAVGIYKLAAGGFVWAFALVMSAVEFVNVGLVYVLAGRAQGGLLARRAVLLYALCPLPVWFALGWFDALAVLAMLVSVLLLVNRRAVGAGAAVGAGILVKVSPGMLVLAAPLALGWRGALRFGVAVVATLAVLLAPFLLTRPDLLAGLIGSLLTRPPWETLPALALRIYVPGILVPIEDRYTAASGWQPTGPWAWIALAPQLAMLLVALWGAWWLTRSGRSDPWRVCLLSALCICSFLLGGKGFSPQFVVWLLPWLAIMWPNRVGAGYLALFTLHTLVYYLFVLPTIDRYVLHEVPVVQVASVAWASVLVRTLLLLAVVGHLCLLVYRAGRGGLSLDQRGRTSAGSSTSVGSAVVSSVPGAR
jgi:hypothetical protein